MTFRLILFLLILLYCQAALFAQKKHQITGTLVDAESQPMMAATVVLLQLPDSSFMDYGLSSDDGTFRLTGHQGQDFVLQITYIGFVPYIQNISLDKDYALGIIKMEEATNMLAVAQIEANYIPLQMRGDTLQFNSAAFSVQAHDDVEKLLEQMPGVEIGADGSIKVNGKKVEKILLDGREFFGDDIKAALKSLPADAIKTIDVFDKKTDKEELTGLKSKDGKKTINLTLKEDKKEGFMGSLEAGYGYPNHRYKGNLSLHYFNSKMRISLIGSTNNINQASFSGEDFYSLSGGHINFMRKHSEMSIEPGWWRDPTIGLLHGGQRGVTSMIAGGINGSFFFTGKTDLDISYMYFNADKKEQNKSSTRMFVPENYYTNNSNLDKILLAQKHVITTKFTHRFDSTQEMRVRLRISLNDSKDKWIRLSETLAMNDSLTNSMNQQSVTDNNNTGVISSVYYQKKLQKKGRSFSANTAFAYTNGQNIFNNNSYTSIYNNTFGSETDTLDQEQSAANNKMVYGAEIAYTEPVGKGNILDFTFAGGFSKEDNGRQMIDRVGGAEFINTNLTDAYQKNYNFQQLAIQFKREVEKYYLSASIELKRSALQGIIASSGTAINQEYYYPIAGLGLEYKFTEQKVLSIYYDARILTPGLEQLQPLPNNQNPLVIRLGNPNLAPEYYHSIWLSYTFRNQKNFTSGSISAYLDISQNIIVESQDIDASFRAVYTPVNLDQSYRAGIFYSNSFNIKKVIKLAIISSAGINQEPMLVNGIKSEQLSHSYGLRTEIGNKDKKIFDFQVSAEVDFSNNIYSSDKSLNTSYINHGYTAKARVTIAKKWTISSEFKYQVFEEIGHNKSMGTPLLSASISRTFLKEDVLKIEISAENLFNESFLINRNNLSGHINELKTSLLGRYFMLTIRYKISKMSSQKELGNDLD